MGKIIEYEHWYIFRSKDSQGIFEFRIDKDCEQIQLEIGIDYYENEVFVDINKKDLIEIRDMINKILKNTEL